MAIRSVTQTEVGMIAKIQRRRVAPSSSRGGREQDEPRDSEQEGRGETLLMALASDSRDSFDHYGSIV